MQVPPWQMSPVVQALPSSQAFELLRNAHPLAGLHESVVQAFPSLQLTDPPLTHAPPWQLSPVVQASLSSQELPLAFWGFEQCPV